MTRPWCHDRRRDIMITVKMFMTFAYFFHYNVLLAKNTHFMPPWFRIHEVNLTFLAAIALFLFLDVYFYYKLGNLL